MGTTSRMAIPYPEPTDFVADGATAMENLADKVDEKTGLIHVKSSTIVSGSIAHTVTNCFSSTFRNYRVVFDNLSTSVGSIIYIRFGAVVANYYGSLKRFPYVGAESTTTRNNAAEAPVIDGTTSTGNSSLTLDIYSPNIGVRTLWSGHGNFDGTTCVMGGMLASGTVFTDFYILAAGATLSGGTIRVYGYNNG